MRTRTIKLASHVVIAAACPYCPGGLLISPPGDLEKHIELQHVERVIEITCRRCKEPFSATRPRRKSQTPGICPKCRATRLPPRARRKYMSSTGVEKKDSIKTG